MKTIVVDDESYMLKGFERMSKDIPDIELAGMFQKPSEALSFAEHEKVDLAILDITMPHMNGLDLAKNLRRILPDILIVFISAYDEYLPQTNELGADYFIIKPYKRETLVRMAEKMKLLVPQDASKIQIKTFGRFSVLKGGEPIKISGKPKEILAYLVTARGDYISNDKIYTALWENRERTNDKMKVYYNALRRLKDILIENGIEELLQSSPKGHAINTMLVDCDYYNYLDGKELKEDRFEGEFLSEYSWGEYILGKMMFE